MTTTDLTLDGLPGEPELPTPEPPVPAAADPRRRAKLLLLLLLSLLVALVAGFAFWYLLYRKPISELPIPAIVQTRMPTYQSAAYGLVKPLGIAVSADGSRMYVTQSGGSSEEALVLDSHGTKLGTLAPPTSLVQQPAQRYVAVNPANGDVWTTDRTAGMVYVYAADGTYKERFDPGQTYAGWQPLGIAFDGRGDVFVTDAGGAAQVVHEFTTDGALVRDFGASEGLSFPNGVAADVAGNVYITDSNNGRLLVFDAAGARVATVSRGSAAEQLGMPRGIVIDDQNRVYIVDTSAQRVQVYGVIAGGQASPQYVNAFGTEGTVDGAFEYPNGIAVDARGRVYVADWGNDRVQVWGY